MNYKRLKSLYDMKKYPILSVKPGQYLEIHENIGDGNNTRIWKFRGLVIKVKKPQHSDGTFTIRGSVARTVIEKIYPLSFEKFDKVFILDEYKIRRSKLYYIRDKVGKGAKFKSNIELDRKELDIWDEALKNAETRFKNVSVEEVKEENKEEVKEEVKKEVKKENKKEE